MITFNDDQQAAIDAAINNKFAIITGGAGTGKTTIIKEIAKHVKNVRLCCPTGKAAARLREATGMRASTIHSLMGFLLNKPLNGMSLIIDESSMIDSGLMAAIIKANPEKIILLGDEAQLSPVGAGQPFHDLIKLRSDIVYNLTTCYRNREAVYKAATKIRNGEPPAKMDNSDAEKWEIRHTGDSEKTISTICEWVQSGGIDFENDIILSPKNDFVDAVNIEILKIINPHNDGEAWKENDRIMCCKNFPDIDTWNGTTGTITAIDGRGRAWVRGDIPFNTEDGGQEQEILWSKEVLGKCKHAYALTVHKSQGSQYRNVIFCSFPRDEKTILSRSLIYTAITRTKKSCVVIGNSHAFYNGIKIIKHRNTVLQELSRMEAGKC